MPHQPSLDNTLTSPCARGSDVKYNDSFIDPADTTVDTTHIHGCYEIYLNLSGDVSFLHDLSVYEINPGDVIISRPGDLHCCIYHSPCKHDHFCLWFREGSAADFLERTAIRGHLRLPEEKRERLVALFFDLLNESADPFLRSACFNDIIALLGSSNSRKREKCELPEKVTEILSYIDSSFRAPCSAREIAEKFFISVPTVNRIIRKSLGLSVHQLVLGKRLSYAENLLKSGKSVTDACYLSGFSDCSRFISLFKKRFGKTPLSYKNSFSKNNQA